MNPADRRAEMSLGAPTLPAAERSIGSLIARAEGQSPEVPAFLAVDPVETAADKGRGGEAAVSSDPTALFAGMFERLATKSA